MTRAFVHDLLHFKMKYANVLFFQESIASSDKIFPKFPPEFMIRWL